MSFHHPQPDKSSSSGGYTPLDSWLQPIGSNSDESMAETAGYRGEPSMVYDEETRFELLSAYLDNEVTADERKLVAKWLTEDSNTQQMYQRLLMLRQAIRTAPVPEQPPLQMPEASHQPWTMLSTWTLNRALVCAIAIALLGSLSQFSTIAGRQQLQEAWQFIKSLPQGALIELASSVSDLYANSIK